MDVKDVLNRVSENISVSRSFGAAYEKDGLLVIPVALVAGGGGGGEGPMGPSNSDSTSESASETSRRSGDQAMGSGGGFGGLTIPLGAYVVKDDSVRWVPVVNVTAIIFAAVCVIRMLVRPRRRGHRHHRS